MTPDLFRIIEFAGSFLLGAAHETYIAFSHSWRTDVYVSWCSGGEHKHSTSAHLVESSAPDVDVVSEFFFFLNINTDTGEQRRLARPAAPAGRASRALKGVFSILKELPRVSLLAPCRLFLYSYIFIDDLLF